MQKCKECNSSVIEGDKYCRSCGIELKNDQLVLEETSSELNPVMQIAETEENIIASEEMVITGETQIKALDQTKKDNIVLRFFFVVVLCFVLFHFLNGVLYNNDVKSNGSINTSFAIKEDKSIFYSYILSDSVNVSKGGLFKINNNSTKSIKLIDDYSIFLCAKNDWIYYTSGDLRKICKVKMDGTEKTVISQSGGVYLTINSNYLYYVEANNEKRSLHKMNINGNGDREIADGIEQYFISGEKIYYKTSKEVGTLFKMDLDGSHKKEACKVSGRIVYADDNYIYYIEPSFVSKMRDSNQSTENMSMFGNVYKMTLDGENRQLVIEGEVERIIPCGKYIYYTTSSATGLSNYRVDFDGKNKKEFKIDGYFITVIDDWIYYISNEDNKIYRTTIDKKNAQLIENELYPNK